MRAWLWGLAAVAFAPIIIFGANGTVILLVLVALTAPGFAAWRRALVVMAAQPVGWALGGLLMLAALSLAWAPAPLMSLVNLSRLFILWFGGCAALAAVREAPEDILKWLVRLLPAAVCLALLFYWIEIATSARLISLFTGLQAAMQARFPTPEEQEYYRLVYGFSAISRGAGLLSIFVWPAMVCCMILLPGRGKWLAAALGIAVFVTVCRLPMGAAPLAMAAGTGAFAWAWVSPWGAPRLMALLIIVLIGVTPFIAYQIPRPETVGVEKRELPGSWQHRVEIWHYTARKIADKPLLGWGFDASRTLGGTTQFVLEQPDGAKITYPGISLLPLHPHNGILQVWLEMGAAGALLVMVMIYGIGQSLAGIVREHGRFGGAMASAVTASALSLSLLSFGQWQSWWQASLWLSAVLCLAVLHGLRATSDHLEI